MEYGQLLQLYVIIAVVHKLYTYELFTGAAYPGDVRSAGADYFSVEIQQPVG